MPKAAQAFITRRMALASVPFAITPAALAAPSDAELIAAAREAVRADKAYNAAADFCEDHPALAAIAAEFNAWCAKVTAMPALTLAGLRAKAQALDTLTLKGADGVTPFERDPEALLTASLVRDLLRMTGGAA